MDFLTSHYAHLVSRDTQNRGYISEDLNIVVLTLSFFLYGLRMYSRCFISKSPGLDDAIISVGVILATTLSILEIKCVEYGAGRQLAEVAQDNPDGLSKFFQTLPTMQLLYFAGTGIVRLGITAFLLRLTSGLARAKTFNKVIYTLAGAITALTIGAFFGLLFECWPVKNLWNKGEEAATCYSAAREADLMYTHAAMGIFFDICLFFVPLWILKSSALVLKARLIVVFTIALVAVVCGLVRLLVILKVNMAVNTTYNIISASVWTDLEIHVGIWVSCFPALQPLLRICYRRLGIKSTISNTKPTTGGYDRYGQNTLQGSRSKESDTWIMLEDNNAVQSRIESTGHAKNDNKNGGIAVSTRVDISSKGSTQMYD